MIVDIPTLETTRLTLRAPKLSDFDTYVDFRVSDRSITVGGPFTRDDSWRAFCAIAGQWIIRGYGRWIVADKTDDTPLGLVGIHYPDDWPEAEIAWTMFTGAEGRGVAYEATIAARNYAYTTLGLDTIISMVDPSNTRSVALAERLGCIKGEIFDHPVYGALHRWHHPVAEGAA